MDKPELFIIKAKGVHSLGTQSSQANKTNKTSSWEDIWNYKYFFLSP